jgi:hypothetical protein
MEFQPFCSAMNINWLPLLAGEGWGEGSLAGDCRCKKIGPKVLA